MVRGKLLPEPFESRSPVSLPMMKAIEADPAFETSLAALVDALDSDTAIVASPRYDGLLDRVLDTGPGRYALERIADPLFNSDETGNIYDGGKAVCGGGHGQWELIFTRHTEEPRYLSNIPQRAFVRCIGGEGECVLKRYRIEGDVSSAANAASWTLTQTAEDPIRPGTSFAFDDPQEAIAFVGRSAGLSFARVVGPLTAPLTHSFRLDDLSYAYTAYANEVVTSHSFYLDLLKRLVGEGVHEDMSETVKSDLSAFLVETGTEGVYPAKTKWMIAQILSRVDPPAASGLVRRYAASGDATLAATASKFID